jgi:hypothetical protein
MMIITIPRNRSMDSMRAGRAVPDGVGAGIVAGDAMGGVAANVLDIRG